MKTRQPRSLFLYLVLVSLSCLALAPVANASDLLRTVILSGDLTPGPDARVPFKQFDFPVLNENGQTAFRAELTGSGVDDSNRYALYSEGGGNGLGLVARQGDPAPEAGAGAVFTYIPAQGIVLSDNGRTAFRPSRPNDHAPLVNWIYRTRENGDLELIAKGGDPAPGASAGVNYYERGFSEPAMNDRGDVAFKGRLTPASTTIRNSGIFSQDIDGGASLVLRNGDAAPDVGSGVTFSSFTSRYPTPVLNNRGQLAFPAQLEGNGVDDTNRSVLVRASSNGEIEIAARQGNGVLKADRQLVFAGLFASPAINDAGQVAFQGTLEGPGIVPGTNDQGIFSEGAGRGLALVALSNNRAPGTDEGVHFAWFNELLLNGSGQTAFTAQLAGPGITYYSNSTAVFSETGGEISLIARAGEQAPGTNSEVTFYSFYSLGLNGRGQTAFAAQLKRSSVDGTNNYGIFAEDMHGDLQLIARTGDLLDVSDDPLHPDFRQIQSLYFKTESGNEDGQPSAFNNLGQVAFAASFSDGSAGVFVSNLAAIPEPSSLALGALAILVGSLRRRERRRNARSLLRPRG